MELEQRALDTAETLTISVGAKRYSQDWAPKRLTWTQFCRRLSNPVRTEETVAEFEAMSPDERAQVKDVGGYVGGEVVGGNRKHGSISNRQLVALDADYAGMELWDEWKTMCGSAAAIHTTHSHTPAHPRVRILIPLSRPVTEEEYEPIARKLAEWIGIEAFDDTTFESERLMYWPSCPRDGEFCFDMLDGAWTNPDAVLSEYDDWHDMREWPRSARQQSIIRRMGDRQGDPLTKPGVIGAFNRAYRITDAIVKFLPNVYARCGEGRWTYRAGSTIGGAVAYDDDTFLYSHHDTDPTHGRLCNAFDLVRLHLFGAQDVGSDAELSNLPSMIAMRELCANDEAVRAELADSIRRDPKDAFGSPKDGLQRFSDDTTELGDAELFIDLYGQNLRYAGAFGWMFWDGTRWRLNAEPEASMLAYRYSDSLYEGARLALQTAQDKAAKAAALMRYKQAVRLRGASGLRNLLTHARTLVNEPDPGRYDSNAWDLNTPGGIIDLRTGAVREHDPDARCTKITACSVSSDGAQQWEAFVQHITTGDAEFADYLQMLAGMAAVGEVYEEGLVISYGPGGNGKSTFFGALRQVLGDYARGINADVMVTTGPTTDQSYVAALRGARLAIMGETEEGARFGVAQMKRLTSRDVISARALYKDPIEFKPTHTTIMHTNHLPRLGSLDGGTRRRVAVAPFPAALPPERVITNYEDVLVRQCGGAILRWIVEGAMRFYNAGCRLPKPACVRKATEDYITDEDAVQTFLEECCTTSDAGARESAGRLYEEFNRWARRNGSWERSQLLFGRTLAEKGFLRVRSNGQRYWQGIRLNIFDGVQQ